MEAKYTGCIYKIENTINNKIYIGQTSRGIKSRWRQHKYAATHTQEHNFVLYNAMNKYGIDNFNISAICEISCDNRDDLNDLLNNLEIYYIDKYNTLIPNGYNLSPGGNNQGVRILKSVDAYFADGTLYKTYESIAAATTDLGDGKSGAGARIPACCKGEAASTMGFIWRYHGDPFDKFKVTVTQEELDRDARRIPVDQYSIDGTFIASFESIYRAAEAINVLQTGRLVIKGRCTGKYNQAYGYVWRLHGEPFDKYPFVENRKYRRVNMYTLNDEYVRSFVSIAEGLRYLFPSSKPPGAAHVSDCCNGKRNSAYGYKWFYADDQNQPDLSRILVA